MKFNDNLTSSTVDHMLQRIKNSTYITYSSLITIIGKKKPWSGTCGTDLHNNNTQLSTQTLPKLEKLALNSGKSNWSELISLSEPIIQSNWIRNSHISDRNFEAFAQ